jgi:hypothetical protein
MTVATDLVLEGLAGERDKIILAMVIAHAWRDASYRARLLAEPKDVLASEGLEFPEGVEVEVVENTSSVTYINIARDTTESSSVVSMLDRLVPIPDGHEIRLVQSTEQKRYFVLPAIPDGLELALATEADLSEAATRVIRNYVYVYAVEAAVAATTVGVAAEVVAVIVLT